LVNATHEKPVNAKLPGAAGIAEFMGAQAEKPAAAGAGRAEERASDAILCDSMRSLLLCGVGGGFGGPPPKTSGFRFT
jgi:hypothetical protein